MSFQNKLLRLLWKKLSMGNKFLVVLLVGIILRIITAFTTFHPDVRTFGLVGSIISSGSVGLIYDYLPYLPSSSLTAKTFAPDMFNYPPAIYEFHGIFNFVWTKVLSISYINDYYVTLLPIFGDLNFNFYLLLVKLPYLLFDIPVAFLLMKLFDSKKMQFSVFTLWMFNPINFFSTYMMGQFDVIPVFFTVLALTLAKSNRLGWAALAIGMGASFKIYPLFFLIPIILIDKTYLGKVKLLFLGIAPYIFFLLPFITSHGFRSTALVAGQSLKSLYAQIPISGGESILIFLFLLLIYYLYIYYKADDKSYLWRHFFVISLLFFTFTHYHPQWLLWVTPFIIIELTESSFGHKLLLSIFLASFIGSLFFFDQSLTVGLFSPIFPALSEMPSVWSQLNLKLDYNFYRSVLQTIFSAAAVFYIYLYLPRPKARG